MGLSEQGTGAPTTIAEAEHRGLEHLLRVFTSGEDFEPLSRDDSDLADENLPDMDIQEKTVI